MVAFQPKINKNWYFHRRGNIVQHILCQNARTKRRTLHCFLRTVSPKKPSVRCMQGEEIVIFVMLQLAMLAVKTTQVSGVHPSDSVAVYLKV